MRHTCLPLVMIVALSARVLSAQDGAAIYKERCASCHDAPEGRVPAISAIKAMSGEAIYVALRCWATSHPREQQMPRLSSGPARKTPLSPSPHSSRR